VTSGPATIDSDLVSAPLVTVGRDGGARVERVGTARGWGETLDKPRERHEKINPCLEDEDDTYDGG